MTMQEFRERAFQSALAQGCEAAETYYAEQEAFEANAQGGEIDRYAVSRTGGLSLRVKLGGRDGYAYTECLDDPEGLVRRAMDNARAIEEEDAHPMQGACTYAPVATPSSALDGVDEAGKLALALQLERETLAQDARVKRVMYCEVGTAAGRIAIHNTLGLAAEREQRMGYAYVMPVMQQGEELQNALAFRTGREAADTAACAAEAVGETLDRFGGEPVPTGTYGVILRGDAMADLLAAFSPMFSAEEAQKGRSLLTGREGETIGAPCVTLVDDPFHPYAPRAFDGEGTPCRRKQLVEAGRLVTLLHNLKTARKAGCESTGNALRASAASPVGVGPTVLYLQPGEQGRDALLRQMGDGLFITSLEGLHAGVDPISGDFSLKACGRRVQGGALGGAVSQITVAGNFLTLLQAVAAVGDDLRFGLPGSVCVGAPSVLVRELMVAGA